LAFPVVCFLIRDHKEVHEAVIKAAPYVRMSLEYTMIYLFAFRGVNLFPGWKSQTKASIKYFIAAACMMLIKRLVALHSMNEVLQYFVTGKVIKAFAMKDLLEIGISYLVMMAGYAKLSKIPFFLTAHLWVIYYVNSYIFYQEVVDNYSRFKDGFMIVHDATLGSMRKFTKITHEPPMALALAGVLTFNLEIELLVVSIANHLLAIVAGYWAISNHTHPYVQSLTKHLSPYVAFRTSQLQHDIAYFAICLILSVQVHYWWTLSERLAKLTGRHTEFAIDPWTVRQVRTWRDKVHDIYDYVKDGALHVYEDASHVTQHAYDLSKEGAKHAYSAGVKGAHVALDEAKHLYQEAAKTAGSCSKKK
jgi:hypothetical protein